MIEQIKQEFKVSGELTRWAIDTLKKSILEELGGKASNEELQRVSSRIDFILEGTDTDTDQFKELIALMNTLDRGIQDSIVSQLATKLNKSEFEDFKKTLVVPFDEKIKIVKLNFGNVSNAAVNLAQDNFYQFEKDCAYEITLSARQIFNRPTNMEINGFLGSAGFGLYVEANANTQSMFPFFSSTALYHHTADSQLARLNVNCKNPNKINGETGSYATNRLDFIYLIIKKMNINEISTITV